jgi:hypothetical protein
VPAISDPSVVMGPLTEDATYQSWRRAVRAVELLYDCLDAQDADAPARSVDDALGLLQRALPEYVGSRRPRATPALRAAIDAVGREPVVAA